MPMQLRYRGSFLGRHNQEWRVDILQESSAAFTVGELTFEAEEPLVIEWQRTDKHDVIQGSTATIRLESPGDRTYADLYTIAVGTIRMEVYKGTALYWSGTLDPEFYEEPYERAANYPVTFTFSDFGILDRLKYDMTGVQTLSDILMLSLLQTRIIFGSVNVAATSTFFPNSETKARLDLLEVRSDNFYDEDGEACTLREVISGILQPLALRMIQRSGNIYIYDINGLAATEPREIQWDGDSQTMGVDKVANNVRVTFSPYASASLLDLDGIYGGYHSPETYGVPPDDVYKATIYHYDDDTDYVSFYPDQESYKLGRSSSDRSDLSFTIFTSRKGSGLSLGPASRFFHIEPLVGGPSECEGVVWCFSTAISEDLYANASAVYNSPTAGLNGPAGVVMTTPRMYLPPVDDYRSYYIRLTQEILADGRYNPFNSEDNNGSIEYNRIKDNAQWAFIPIAVTLYDNNGNALLHYDNSARASSASMGIFNLAIGTWEVGAASFGDAWLEYYDPEDLKDGCGILGWKTNRQSIGRPDTDERRRVCGAEKFSKIIADSFKKMPDGEYIPYPDQGGWLEVKVYQGMDCYDYGETAPWGASAKWDVVWDCHYKQMFRWMLYKSPTVQVVKNNLLFDGTELEDIEYSGYINKAAKDDIKIDTICGTSPNYCPTARGILYNAQNHTPITKLTRAGVTDCPERLLIGTLYSQYADRKTVLSGEALLDTGGLCAYTETNQPGKVFMMSGEVQDIISDTSEVTLTEICPDEYVAIEEIEE